MKFSYIYLHFLLLNNFEIFLHLSTFFSLESLWNFCLQYIRISCLFYFFTPSQSSVADTFVIEIVRCIYAYMLAICVPLFVFRAQMLLNIHVDESYRKCWIFENFYSWNINEPRRGFGKLNIHRTKRKTFGRLYSRIQIIEISASSLNTRMLEDFGS